MATPPPTQGTETQRDPHVDAAVEAGIVTANEGHFLWLVKAPQTEQ
jgi:hypothetical protein